MTDTPEIILSQQLIRCPSVTPHEAGAISLLIKTLEPLGFTTELMRFIEPNKPDTDNLWAVITGKKTSTDPKPKHLCFAGHTDVVPVGNLAQWTHDPFEAKIIDGMLYGRGASDMKSAIAAFVIAVQEFLEINQNNFSGKISLMITGDEEGCGTNGTKKMVKLLQDRGIDISHCLVGEPTNPEILGTMIKVGRRGSLNVDLIVTGKQGHVAYPHRAENPVPKLVKLMNFLADLHLDSGNSLFQSSNLELTCIAVDNPSDNVIPHTATGRFNVRFNSEWTGQGLQDYLSKQIQIFCQVNEITYDITFRLSGESFLTQDSFLTSILRDSIIQVTDIDPELSTTGGTSDARFIKDLCPVIEFGIVGQTMHQHNEAVLLSDITKLKSIYLELLKRYFK